MRTREDLLHELPVVVRLDPDTLRAWHDGLSDNDRAILREIIDPVINNITLAFEELRAAFYNIGLSIGESLASGIVDHTARQRGQALNAAHQAIPMTRKKLRRYFGLPRA